MSASAKHLASGRNQARADNKPARAVRPVEEAEEEGEVAVEGAPAGRSREELADLAAGARITATTSRSA